MALTKTEKKQQRKLHTKCYVCNALGLTHSGFAGYSDSEIQFDHWKPKGLVAGDQSKLVANQLPIHAAAGGASYQDPNYRTAAKRNCHKGKGSRFASGEEWVQAVSIWMRALELEYSDDLLPGRTSEDESYKVDIEWDDSSNHVLFNGDRYPMMVQTTKAGGKGIRWRSFSTVVVPSLLWHDSKVQTRAADQQRVAELAIHLQANPLLSPILCRLEDRLLNVFDGNHRLCAFLLARPNDPVPVTIFEGPNPKQFLEVVAQAHDELTQQKYQYTAKALKYSSLHQDELAQAEAKHGSLASEKLAWADHTGRTVRLRIVGGLTEYLDRSGGWREKWKLAGLTDKSWNEFLTNYAYLKAVSEPFSSSEYHREHERKNLEFLCTVFDEELFDVLGAKQWAAASLKTKWWKLAHRRLASRLGQVVRDAMKLSQTPKHPAYVPGQWDDYVRSRIRSAVKNWTDSPMWRADTVANNEKDISDQLDQYDFSETYLIG